MAKQLLYRDDAVKTIRSGVDKLSNAVKSTLGPRGRYVVLEKKFGSPVITNDGVTIAKEIELDDPNENLGAQLVREIATKTNDIAGDGTTTACVLAQALITEGFRNIAAGANPIHIKYGIDKAVKSVVDDLDLLGIETVRLDIMFFNRLRISDEAIEERIRKSHLAVFR